MEHLVSAWLIGTHFYPQNFSEGLREKYNKGDDRDSWIHLTIELRP